MRTIIGTIAGAERLASRKSRARHTSTVGPGMVLYSSKQRVGQVYIIYAWPDTMLETVESAGLPTYPTPTPPNMEGTYPNTEGTYLQ